LWQINANISTINSSMHSTIDAKMKALKQDMTKDLSSHMESQLESFAAQLFAKLNIHGGLPSFDQPLHPEGDTSSTSRNFQYNHFQRDLRLPRVDVNKFDGSNPTDWVTQLEHYFSLHDITDELAKLCYGVLHLDLELWQWWQ
jgi:hypothetical protein